MLVFFCFWRGRCAPRTPRAVGRNCKIAFMLAFFRFCRGRSARKPGSLESRTPQVTRLKGIDRIDRSPRRDLCADGHQYVYCLLFKTGCGAYGHNQPMVRDTDGDGNGATHGKTCGMTQEIHPLSSTSMARQGSVSVVRDVATLAPFRGILDT